MTGSFTTSRVYLDWNATAPLRAEARAAMLAAMDVGGNPSSVHAEGRAARALVERARAQVAGLMDCDPDQVVFTSGATEAAALAVGQRRLACSPLEHDCVWRLADPALGFGASTDGVAAVAAPAGAAVVAMVAAPAGAAVVAMVAAQNETGVLQPVADAVAAARAAGAGSLVDAAQTAGRAPAPSADYVLVSAHKLGGPKGVGALIARAEPPALTGGQERGRRAGTENLIGIAGFGAAADVARRELETGVWPRVARLRDALEERILSAAPEAFVVGAQVERLPNTTCLALPGWRGETQVMQMDLAGVAVSAGSACSSGKTGPSRALRAMGLDETAAASAIRVSLGPTTTEADVARFCDAWLGFHAKRRLRAA